jgi:hypothetical protein
MRVVRVLGVLEPGGAQLSALLLSAALRRHGVATVLLAGDATPSGVALAARYGFDADVFRVGKLANPHSLQWTPEPAFADWLRLRLLPADLVHAHMVGAWWAAARAVPPQVPLVASEHNQMSWPGADHTRRPGRRHGGLTCSLLMGRRSARGRRGWACAAGCARGARRWRGCPPGRGRVWPGRG